MDSSKNKKSTVELFSVLDYVRRHILNRLKFQYIFVVTNIIGAEKYKNCRELSI